MGDDGTPLLHECLKWARKLSSGEIRTALRFLQDEFKESRTPAAALALRPGDWVEMTKTVHRLAGGGAPGPSRPDGRANAPCRAAGFRNGRGGKRRPTGEEWFGRQSSSVPPVPGEGGPPEGGPKTCRPKSANMRPELVTSYRRH